MLTTANVRLTVASVGKFELVRKRPARDGRRSWLIKPSESGCWTRRMFPAHGAWSGLWRNDIECVGHFLGRLRLWC
jgi:hypothetical protein